MGRPHSRLKSQVMEALKARGWPVVSYPSDGYTGPSTSDNLACVPPEGWFLAVEVKTEGDKPSENDPRWIRQKRFLGMVRRAGGIAVWGKSLAEILDKIDRELENRRAGST